MADEINKGSRVVVVKGRKAPIGTTGTVFWTGDNKFGDGRRFGIEGDDGETYWIPEENVEKTDLTVPEVEPPEKGDVVAWSKNDEAHSGTVFWVGESKSGRGHRVGVKDATGETHWLDARQVESVATSTDDGEEPPF